MMKLSITAMATAVLIAHAATCLAGGTNSPGILKHPHGPWTSVTNDMSISAGPHDTNTFTDSDIMLKLYIKLSDGNPPELTGNGLSVDIAVPDEYDAARTKPHVWVRLNEDIAWTETALGNVYVASIGTVKLRPAGRWGVSISATLNVNGKVIASTTDTCYFTVK